tara:strand:+ start:31499 stop:32104 length:606 start_codon:yes stop_codon:yes gene_type:complete
MEKVTKKELQQKINVLQSKNITNRNLIFRTMRALASIDIDIMDDKFDATDEPKLKQLDQSVFDDLDAKWRWLGVNSDGTLLGATYKPKISVSGTGFILLIGSSEVFGEGYDTTNWQNSLIERDKVELTGSDLCRAMLERGDKFVMCYLSGSSDMSAKDVKGIVYGYASNHEAFKVLNGCMWSYAVPINNQGEPLTASEVGL